MSNPFNERNYVSDLNVKMDRLVSKKVQFDDQFAVYMFTQIRCLLEYKRSGYRFPTLMLYANWIVHSKLDRDQVGAGLLMRIVQVLRENLESDKDVAQKVSAEFGVEKVKDELKTLFAENGINPLLVGEKWREVIGQILRLVVSKPIVLDNRRRVGVLPAYTINTVTYNGYPCLWLSGSSGEEVRCNIAILREDDDFSMSLVREHDRHQIFIYNSGLFFQEK